MFRTVSFENFKESRVDIGKNQHIRKKIQHGQELELVIAT